MALLVATTGAVAAGLLTAQAASNRRRREMALYALARDPAFRHEVRRLRAAEDSMSVQMLVVQIGSGALAPQLAGKSFEVCAKLGEAGRSIRHTTARARSNTDGTVHFGDSFVLPWQPHAFTPVLRVRLNKIGVFDSNLAKEEFWLPFGLGSPDQSVEHEVLLHAHGTGELLGHLTVSVLLESFPVSELRQAGFLPHHRCLRHLHPLVLAPPGAVAATAAGYAPGYPPAAAAAGAPVMVAGHIVRPGDVVTGRVVGGAAPGDRVVMGRPAGAPEGTTEGTSPNPDKTA